MVYKKSASIDPSKARDFDHLGLHLHHAEGPDHRALEGRAFDRGFDRFELAIGIDKAEMQLGTVHACAQQSLLISTQNQGFAIS